MDFVEEMMSNFEELKYRVKLEWMNHMDKCVQHVEDGYYSPFKKKILNNSHVVLKGLEKDIINQNDVSVLSEEIDSVLESKTNQALNGKGLIYFTKESYFIAEDYSRLLRLGLEDKISDLRQKVEERTEAYSADIKMGSVAEVYKTKDGKIHKGVRNKNIFGKLRILEKEGKEEKLSRLERSLEDPEEILKNC